MSLVYTGTLFLEHTSIYSNSATHCLCSYSLGADLRARDHDECRGEFVQQRALDAVSVEQLHRGQSECIQELPRRELVSGHVQWYVQT